MSSTSAKQLEERLRRLQTHLEQENPALADAVRTFRRLDRAAYQLGVLQPDESFATRVSWWPVIAVLGTFSAGKSTFINSYLDHPLQAPGNQAVDDKFTVICYGHDSSPRVLPGLALDSDPRFPFYRMSDDVERVAEGEGRRIDSYLQLKTCPSERLRGKILIDSPGFDADAQRTSTLHIVDHIIDLSDLVLVFFDARHPEPGAMRDTLRHLVGERLADASPTKFLYILNQMDAAAHEDNPEEVFAAWQRALAQHGLLAGRFYRIYDEGAAPPLRDPERRRRFEGKRDEDLAAIYSRLQEVEVERAYRVAGVLEQTAKDLRDDLVPALRREKARWLRRTRTADAIAAGVLAALLLALAIANPDAVGTAFRTITGSATSVLLTLAGLLGIVIAIHASLRRALARRQHAQLERRASESRLAHWLARAFSHDARSWWPVGNEPVGWTRRTYKHLAQVSAEAAQLVQGLNDRFTQPSGTAERVDDSEPRGERPPAESQRRPDAVDHDDTPPPDTHDPEEARSADSGPSDELRATPSF